MTKVQLRLGLSSEPDEAMMKRIAAAHSQFGMLRVQLGSTIGELVVEYDASRLAKSEVVAALHRAGIPAIGKPA
jgi:hypothetical protein